MRANQWEERCEMRDARNEEMNRIRQQKPSKSVSTSLKFIRSLPVCNGIRVRLVNPRPSMEARRFTKNGSQSRSVRRRKWVSTLLVGIDDDDLQPSVSQIAQSVSVA